MEKNIQKLAKLEKIIKNHKMDNLFFTFKTFQGYLESKRISGLNIEDFSLKDDISVNISHLSYNVNSQSPSIDDSDRYCSNDSNKINLNLKKNMVNKIKHQKSIFVEGKNIKNTYQKIINGEFFQNNYQIEENEVSENNSDVNSLHNNDNNEIINNDQNKIKKNFVNLFKNVETVKRSSTSMFSLKNKKKSINTKNKSIFNNFSDMSDDED